MISGQAPPAQQQPRPQMADEVFKNVTVLKGLQVDEFMDTMGMIAAALGLNCLDCHTSDADKSWERFAADTTMKQTSRRMIQMVSAINKENFKGVRSVTCYTCHRGDLRPKVVPSLIVQYSAPMEDPNEVEIPPNSKGSADEVFNKYLNALGGTQRLAAFRSYTAKGTYVGFDTHHTKVPVEIAAKAPNQKNLHHPRRLRRQDMGFRWPVRLGRIRRQAGAVVGPARGESGGPEGRSAGVLPARLESELR